VYLKNEKKTNNALILALQKYAIFFEEGFLPFLTVLKVQ